MIGCGRQVKKGPRGWCNTPGPGPQKGEQTVDTPMIQESSAKVPAPTDETPHGCYDGWVYLGFEGEDENGEYVEVIERVPCRRCNREAR